MRRRLALLLVVAGTAVGTLIAQGLRQYSTEPPRLVRGNNIGFRIEGTDPRTGQPVGSWMLRINGEWVVVGSAPIARPVK
jgi:hypothetical protein